MVGCFVYFLVMQFYLLVLKLELAPYPLHNYRGRQPKTCHHVCPARAKAEPNSVREDKRPRHRLSKRSLPITRSINDRSRLIPGTFLLILLNRFCIAEFSAPFSNHSSSTLRSCSLKRYDRIPCTPFSPVSGDKPL